MGAGDDNVTGDEGNDTILPGPGADFVYAEEGSNHVILYNDGAKDLIYCRHEKFDSGDGYVTYVGTDRSRDSEYTRAASTGSRAATSRAWSSCPRCGSRCATSRRPCGARRSARTPPARPRPACSASPGQSGSRTGSSTE